MDATAIGAPDGHFDLAVFAFSFHHLPPALASQAFAEGTRVAAKLLIIDLPRPPSPLHLLRLATMLPFAPVVPFMHDGLISSLRTYSPSALRALAEHADPAIDVQLRGGLMSASGRGGQPQCGLVVVVHSVAAPIHPTLRDENDQEDRVEDSEQKHQATEYPQGEHAKAPHAIRCVLGSREIPRRPQRVDVEGMTERRERQRPEEQQRRDRPPALCGGSAGGDAPGAGGVTPWGISVVGGSVI